MLTKAVLPVAGLGTRFLPASKAIPKEMLTVVDKPVIQYVVEEAVAAGIREIVLVTHSAKRAIEDHFDVNYELESELERRGKIELLNTVRQIIPDGVRVIAVRQGQALGLGHAVLCAREVIGESPFAVLLPDVLVDQAQGADQDLRCMLARYESTGNTQIMVEAVPEQDVDQYGIADLQEAPEPGQSRPMTGLVEKPSPDQAPSNLSVVGRYVLPPEIFELLAQTKPGAGNEIQLTDALDALLKTKTLEAYRMQGVTYDCGNKLGYLQATLNYAAKHPVVGEAFEALLRQQVEALS